MRGNTRRTAAFVVASWIATKEFPQTMLPDGPDRAFVQDLVYTVIRHLRPLRLVLGKLVSRWPKGELEALLYVGAAQILYMDSVPDFAAVNETVDAAKCCENPSIAKMVNGVLRNLIRRKDELTNELATAVLEVRESFPTILVRRWLGRFGDERTGQLCRWHNTPAETWLARKDGSFTVLERGKCVKDVDGYESGDFIVQDPGTRLAVELMDVQPGESVLDACAAPGGKSIQMSWRGAQVVACEVNPRRRSRLEENVRRLGLNIHIVGEFGKSGFPKVLVDAPCSNTGVLRRRPDARWNWNEQRLAQLVKLQAQILDQCAALVLPGGTLVYSTCSIEPEENQHQVQAFLSRHPNFELLEERESLPFESGMDGAFAAKLRLRI